MGTSSTFSSFIAACDTSSALTSSNIASTWDASTLGTSSTFSSLTSAGDASTVLFEEDNWSSSIFDFLGSKTSLWEIFFSSSLAFDLFSEVFGLRLDVSR